MIAILTADIIESKGLHSSKWMPALKRCLKQWGDTPLTWEIYRGDEIQLRLAPVKALMAAIQIKAAIRSIKGLDIRISIGVGTETYVGSGVSESNGTAYQRSGRTLEELKKNKVNLMLSTPDEAYNEKLNLMLRLASDFMDNWSTVSAEIISLSLVHPTISQKSLADQLSIKQSAVSQRLKRARWQLTQELLEYYANTIEKVKE